MQTRTIQVPLRDGVMGAYLAIPDGPPAGKPTSEVLMELREERS